MNEGIINIEPVREKIAAAAIKSGRDAKDITLVAVTKTVDASRIKQAVMQGVSEFGENRVQELLEKYDEIPNVHWHLIGHLQTNKVKYIIDKVDLIQSVDSLKLAEEINLRAKAIDKCQRVLIQVNIEGEESKFGIFIDDCEKLLLSIAELSNIKVCGLMTIPPLYPDLEQTRKVLQKCNNLFVDIREKRYHNITMEILSMGMSEDFELAIEEGATMVRLGRTIFGTR